LSTHGEKMKSDVFREYDIRGIVGTEIKIEETYELTQAILSYFLKLNPNTKKIVFGMDGRTHGPTIKKEMLRATTEMGIDVLDIGVCPTPVLYFATFTTGIPHGLILTASHNPKEYNGVKICFNKKSVWGKQVQEIRKIFEEKSFAKNKTKKIGTVETFDANDAYTTWLTEHFSHLKNKEINAVIDCGNGTAGTVLPQLIKKMNLQNIELLYEEVDGTFPNHEADPTTLKNMLDVKSILKTKKNINVGLGFDGDCDRMNPMTKNGELVPGDKMVALYSKNIIQKNPGAPIIFDIKSSSSLLGVVKKWGATPLFSPSGHSIIKNNLYKNNALLAGELSCHFFFNDRYFGYDDGIYAALRLFEILHKTNISLEEMLDEFPKQCSSREYRITCAEKDKTAIVEHVKKVFNNQKSATLLTIDGVRAHTPEGWGLIRASNTQPVVCLRFESNTPEGLQKIKNNFCTALKPYYSQKELDEQFEK